MPGRARSAPTDESPMLAPVEPGEDEAGMEDGRGREWRRCHMSALTSVPEGAVGAGCTTRSDWKAAERRPGR
jgi:hypothetical protein